MVNRGEFVRHLEKEGRVRSCVFLSFIQLHSFSCPREGKGREGKESSVSSQAVELCTLSSIYLLYQPWRLIWTLLLTTLLLSHPSDSVPMLNHDCDMKVTSPPNNHLPTKLLFCVWSVYVYHSAVSYRKKFRLKICVNLVIFWSLIYQKILLKIGSLTILRGLPSLCIHILSTSKKPRKEKRMRWKQLLCNGWLVLGRERCTPKGCFALLCVVGG